MECIKKAIDKRKPMNAQALWKFTEEEWANLDKKKELLENLVHSMPSKINAIIEAKDILQNINCFSL